MCAYVTTADLIDRIEYEAADFYDVNEQQQFEDLVGTLESEAVGLLESRWGDQTFEEETDKTETFQATDDAALLMPYPITDVSKVEVKVSIGADWNTLDSDRYDFTPHRLILAETTRRRSSQYHTESHMTNPLNRWAGRATWGDYYAKLRVTYTRGFDPLPEDVSHIVIEAVENMLRDLRIEQTVDALDPSQAEQYVNAGGAMPENLKEKIDTITSPGGATLSV